MALNLDQIRTTAQRVAASHGLDVVDVEYLGGGGNHRNLCVYIEKNATERAKLAAQPEPGNGPGAHRLAGITHDDCTAFSRDFGTVLDVEDLIPGTEYTLEVSSPGLDRRLYSKADYERFADSLIKLQTFEPVAGNRHWQGRLIQVGDNAIALDLGALKQKNKGKNAGITANPRTVEIELANIEKSNLIPEI
jgi:ribosome maturation factor RimP